MRLSQIPEVVPQSKVQKWRFQVHQSYMTLPWNICDNNLQSESDGRAVIAVDETIYTVQDGYAAPAMSHFASQKKGTASLHFMTKEKA